MTTDLRVMTGVVLVLPVLLAIPAVFVPAAVSATLGGTTVFMVLLYVLVWFAFRPTAFEVSDEALRIVWPVRARSIPRSEIVSVRTMTAADFRAEYGLGMRIGVGGLWGGFGLLQTSRVTFSMWISRTDSFVLVTLKSDRPLLLTPESPGAFIESLSAG